MEEGRSPAFFPVAAENQTGIGYCSPLMSGRGVGAATGVTWPRGGGTGVGVGVTIGKVNRPIWFACCSVNQMRPSAPTAIPMGLLAVVGIGYSVTSPLVVTRPSLDVARSVNQRLPSGP